MARRLASMRQLKAIFADEKRLKDYHAGLVSGLRGAAQFISQFDKTSSHPYRLSDCLLAKFNMRKKKVRKNRSSGKG